LAEGEVGVEERGRRPVQQAQLPPTPAPGRSEGRLRDTRPLRHGGRRGREHLRDEGPGEPEPQQGADEVAPARLPACHPPHPCAQLLFLQPHGSPPRSVGGDAPCALCVGIVLTVATLVGLSSSPASR
jgi:hypothetical protein